MTRFMSLLHKLGQLAKTLLTLLVEVSRFVGLCLYPSPALAAENLFLRKQLAIYQERQVKPRRTTHALRIVLVWLARWFDWRKALAVVQHMSPGPGIPRPPAALPVPPQVHRYRIPEHLRVVARPILGGLHHDYRLRKKAS